MVECEGCNGGALQAKLAKLLSWNPEVARTNPREIVAITLGEESLQILAVYEFQQSTKYALRFEYGISRVAGLDRPAFPFVYL